MNRTGASVLDADPSDPTRSANVLAGLLVPNPKRFPERGPATVARLVEIAEIVISETPRRERIVRSMRKALGERVDLHDRIRAEHAARVTDVLLRELNPTEGQRFAQLLLDSELSTDEVVSLHRRHKIPVSELEDDLLPVRGKGARIWDAQGRTYLDLDSNYSATNLGNANPELGQGLFNQACQLVSQKEDRIQVARARFLKEIGDLLPPSLCCFYWQNSGGEAVDKALKIGKAYTGKTGVVAFEGGFHGRTHGAVAVTHNPAYRQPFGLSSEPWVHFAPYGDLNAVDALLSRAGVGSVILELVQGEEAGVRPADPVFAQGLREMCDHHQAVLIVDEVQTGFGRVARTAGDWFASQRYGIEPDIMTIGKSFGGGYPVTAVVTNPEISERMKPGYDGSTFGGNPMAMTAALIATRQMRRLNLTERVAEISRRVVRGLSAIESPLFLGFRVAGMMIGIDLISPACVREIQDRLKTHGVHSSLSTGATMRWMPPLVITDEEMDYALGAFWKSLGHVQGDYSEKILDAAH